MPATISQLDRQRLSSLYLVLSWMSFFFLLPGVRSISLKQLLMFFGTISSNFQSTWFRQLLNFVLDKLLQPHQSAKSILTLVIGSGMDA